MGRDFEGAFDHQPLLVDTFFQQPEALADLRNTLAPSNRIGGGAGEADGAVTTAISSRRSPATFSTELAVSACSFSRKPKSSNLEQRVLIWRGTPPVWR